jgi:hypothetical protein
MLEISFNIKDSKAERKNVSWEGKKTDTSDNKLFFSTYKGQISMEMMSYYIILFGVFLVTFIVVVSNQRIIEEEKTVMDARRILVMAKNEIDVATNVGDGYSHSFFLPQFLQGGVDYSISVSSETQEINIVYNDRNISLPLLTSNVTSSIKKGNNIIKNAKGLITFE